MQNQINIFYTSKTQNKKHIDVLNLFGKVLNSTNSDVKLLEKTDGYYKNLYESQFEM